MNFRKTPRFRYNIIDRVNVEARRHMARNYLCRSPWNLVNKLSKFKDRLALNYKLNENRQYRNTRQKAETMTMMDSTKTQDRNNEHDGLHKNTRQKQWARWTPQKHKTETMSMMDSTKTQERNNEHYGLHKNTRQKQWAWRTPQKHKTETMSMMDSTKTQDRNNEHDVLHKNTR